VAGQRPKGGGGGGAGGGGGGGGGRSRTAANPSFVKNAALCQVLLSDLEAASADRPVFAIQYRYRMMPRGQSEQQTRRTAKHDDGPRATSHARINSR